MARIQKEAIHLHPDAHRCCSRTMGVPVSRRQFIRQGLMTGSASVLSTGGVFGMFANPNLARAAVAPDLDALATDIGCILGGVGAGQSIPFISFDLAGGANFAGSNVLVGQGRRPDGSVVDGGLQQTGTTGGHASRPGQTPG